MRRERLSAQLVADIREVQALTEIREDKIGSRLDALKEQTRRKEAMVVRLLQEGADPNARDFASQQPRFWEMTLSLLNRMFGHQPAPESLPPSALAIAVQADDTVVATALLQAGASDVNAKIQPTGDSDQFPLVNYSVHLGNLEIVKALCAHRADLHKRTLWGHPILEAVLAGQTSYRYPQNKAADISQRYDVGRRTEIFHLLQAQGVQYEANSKDGYERLLEAVDGNFLEVTKELLAAGVSPNAKQEWSHSFPYAPLRCAVEHNNPALVKLLLQYGAPKDANSEKLLLEHRAGIHPWGNRGAEIHRFGHKRNLSVYSSLTPTRIGEYGAKR